MNDAIVIVTGGASGIGRAVGERLRADGWRVAPFDVSREALDSAWGDAASGDAAGVLPIVCDVADRASVEAAVAAVEGRGVIRGLVTCAGIYRAASMLEVTDEDFDALMAVNVRGTFLACQVVARSMARTGGGSIVTVTSVAGSEPTAENGAYATTKGAVDTMTRAFAISGAPHGIRVNAVQPGPIATPMGAAATVDPAYEERMLRRVMLGRFGDPADVAGAAAFLLGEDSRFTTGSVIRVDGGVLAQR